MTQAVDQTTPEVVPPLGTEGKRIFRLFSPIFLGQIAQTSMGVVDTLMAGAAGTEQLSGVAIAGSFFWPVLLFIIGLCFAVSPIVAQLRGAGKPELIAARLHVATITCLLFSFVVAALMFAAPKLYTLIPDINQEMVRVASGYLYAIAIGIPGFALFNILRAYSEGLGNTMPTLIFGFVALLLNIPLNYICIFGKFGLPAMGGIGCGVATTVTIYLTSLLFLIYVQRHKFYANFRLYRQWYALKWNEIKGFLHLGIPLALSAMIEVTCFSMVSFLLTPFGPIVVSAHAIAMNLSGLLFMFPLSLSNAVTIRVGEAMGARHWKRAGRSLQAAFLLGAVFVLFNCALVLLLRHQIIGLYSPAPEVWALAEVLVVFCVFYQLPDSLQVLSIGVLRGFKDSHTIFMVTIGAYWIVGMPLGFALAYGLLGWEPMAAQGFWIGFIAALFTCAGIYLSRLYYLFTRRRIPKTMQASI